MAKLFVRTGNAGTDPDYPVDDLGIRIETTATWRLISSSATDRPVNDEGDDGQFTARRLRDSEDLYIAITTSGLEWSKDGVTGQPASGYVADYMIVQDLATDDWDLSNGKLVSPGGTTLPTVQRAGEFFYDTTANQLYVSNGSSWEELEVASTPKTLLLDEVSASKYTYVGEAVVGTGTSAAGWRIYRLDESKAGAE